MSDKGKAGPGEFNCFCGKVHPISMLGKVAHPDPSYAEVIAASAPAAPVTRPDLEAIQARADAATEGPWEPIDPYFLASPTQIDGYANPRGRALDQARISNDRAFMASAREDVPALVAALAAERARADQADAKVASVEALRDKWMHDGEQPDLWIAINRALSAAPTAEQGTDSK